MREERKVTVNGESHTVVISDEREALLAASAAGRASVAVWDGKNGEFLPAAFAVESPEDADEEFLQRVVRRKLGLPWEICRTGRLIIREFAESDADSIPPGETGGPGDGIFQDREKLQAYIGQQYGFCQYGIWAVTDKESGRLVGMAGFGPPAGDMDGLEMGYHIFAPWRRRGYGLESCRAVLEWERREIGLPVWARIHRDNTPSLRLAGRLGFQVFREEKEILYLIQNKKEI